MKDSALQLILQAGLLLKGFCLYFFFFLLFRGRLYFLSRDISRKPIKNPNSFYVRTGPAGIPRCFSRLTRNLMISPIANVFRAVYTDEIQKGKSETKRLLRRYETLESVKLEKVS